MGELVIGFLLGMAVSFLWGIDIKLLRIARTLDRISDKESRL